MRLLVLLSVVILIVGCKKDKLKGDYAIFNGTWHWIYTDHDYGWCEGEGYYEQITPDSESYSVIFEEKGYVNFFENGSLLERKRVVVEAMLFDDVAFPYDSKFYINLNNDSENKLRGAFRTDTMILFTFPYLGEAGSEQYFSYFVRE